MSAGQGGVRSFKRALATHQEHKVRKNKVKLIKIKPYSLLHD